METNGLFNFSAYECINIYVHFHVFYKNLSPFKQLTTVKQQQYLKKEEKTNITNGISNLTGFRYFYLVTAAASEKKT